MSRSNDSIAEPRAGFQIAGSAAQRYEQAVAAFMLDWSIDLV
jgi:hypothetical protein